ncbi:MAG TPA: tetratricopeptide repeat protein [Polyangia bacterium]
MIRSTSTRFSTPYLCAYVVLSLILASSTAFAQAEGASILDADARYRSALKEALAEYDANHFEEARILFRRAHEINPNARTLRSIGMASFELRDYVAAVRALSAALVETRKSLSPDQRSHAKGLLERSRMYVDIYSLKISPPDARVLIDGRAPDAESDGTVLLGFGSHTLEASKPGFVLRTLVVDVRGGERKDLIISLERMTTDADRPVASVVPGVVVTSPVEVDQITPSDKMVRPAASGGHAGLGWFITAGGTALAAGGAAYLWWFQNNELKSCHNPPDERPCTNQSAILSRRNLAVGTTLATGVAAVTLAVIGMLSGDSSYSVPTAQSALACTVSLSGLSCTKAF